MVGQLIIQRTDLKKQQEQLYDLKAHHVGNLEKVRSSLKEMSVGFRAFGEDNEGRSCFYRDESGEVIAYPEFDEIAQVVSGIREREDAIDQVDVQLQGLGVFIDPEEEGPTWKGK